MNRTRDRSYSVKAIAGQPTDAKTPAGRDEIEGRGFSSLQFSLIHRADLNGQKQSKIKEVRQLDNNGRGIAI